LCDVVRVAVKHCFKLLSFFTFIIHLRPFAFVATVANGAVRLSISFGLFDLCMYFQKVQVETVANITFFLQKPVGSRRRFGFLQQSASSLVCPSFGDVGRLQKL